MATKREGILSAIKSALVGVTGVSDSNVYRSRAVAFARKEMPAIVVEPVQDIADAPTIHRTAWQMLIQVAVMVRSEVADSDADSIINSIHSKIMSDSTLDSLCVDRVPTSITWQLHDADAGFGVINMNFQIRYQTSTADISA